MDDPALDAGRHLHALRGLERLNRWSRSAKILWPALREAARAGPGELRVLDVATGAGDAPIQLAALAKRHGVSLRIEACDRSERALDHARMQAERGGAA